MGKIDNRLEISARELMDLPRGSYIAIDLREEQECAYGMMEGAVRIPEDALFHAVRVLNKQRCGEAPAPAADSQIPSDTQSPQLPTDTQSPQFPAGTQSALRLLDRAQKEHLPLVLYCRYGRVSLDAAEALREPGWNALSLEGGYGRWVLENSRRLAEDESRRNDIEKDLRKKFKKDLIGRFEKAVVQYQLVEEGDRIAVCISGGKDSMLMAKLFQELKRHNKFPFSLVFLCMDPGYNPENRQIIENNARLLGIPIEFFNTEIFSAVYTIEKSPCYLCARMRRGYLYRFAKEHGCNKIALGHHYDDVIETILMGMLYSGQYQAMMPKLKSTNFEGMELIRPMYLIREADIRRWRDYNGLHFLQCACRFTENCSSCGEDGTSASKRLETKKLIAELSKTIPQVEKNLFRATENVVLNKVLGYKIHGEKHSFLEDY